MTPLNARQIQDIKLNMVGEQSIRGGANRRLSGADTR